MSPLPPDDDDMKTIWPDIRFGPLEAKAFAAEAAPPSAALTSPDIAAPLGEVRWPQSLADDPAFNGGPTQGARPRSVEALCEDEGCDHHGIAHVCITRQPNGPAKPRTASDILREMAQTMDDRNGLYHDNWRMIAPMLRILFPKGVPSEMVTQDFWHLFELLLVKIARFASTNCTHIDSIHDAGNYCGLVQLAIEDTLKDSK